MSLGDGFLSSLGQGFRAAGAILSPAVDEQQAKERLQQQDAQQRNAQALQMIVANAIQNGSQIDPRLQQGLGLGGIGANPLVQAKLQEAQLQAAQAQREAAVFSPQNIAANTIPGQPAQALPTSQEGTGSFDMSGSVGPEVTPAVPGQINMDALRQQAATTGVKGMEAYSQHQAAEKQRLATLEATRQARADALAAKLYDINLRSEDKALDREKQLQLAQERIQAQRELHALIAAGRPESPVQTYTDKNGVLFERERGGSWKPAMGPDGPIIGKKERNPSAEPLYKDYAGNPQVKEANDLEAKMKPLVNYMIDFQKTGKSVNTDDAALAKTYLAVTSSLGNRAYAVDQKALASLPNLGDRLGNAASSFFAGKDLTDQTRKEMFNYITQRYKALDQARAAVRETTAKRAKALNVPEDQVFGAPQ